MVYLKRIRLDGAHRSLQRASKHGTRIIDVATDWGFWHMGHFTSDYRTMFGETPSETLLASKG
jgi:AraC family transcriptional regulator, ethanolamine operon transcriptional activator